MVETGSGSIDQVIRRRVIVRGRVHGVGFGYSTAREAFKLGVTGFARNSGDGAVEVEIEGNQAAVEAMLAWFASRSHGAFIRSVTVSDREPLGSTEFPITKQID